MEGLEQKDKVELLNSHFLDVFASVLNKTPNSSRLAISLFQCLPVLKTITTMQQEAIFNFNIDNPPEDGRYLYNLIQFRSHFPRGRDHMVVGFTTP